jgi:hypothetical protein
MALADTAPPGGIVKRRRGREKFEIRVTNIPESVAWRHVWVMPVDEGQREYATLSSHTHRQSRNASSSGSFARSLLGAIDGAVRGKKGKEQG